jgi:hypothetical protein
MLGLSCNTVVHAKQLKLLEELSHWLQMMQYRVLQILQWLLLHSPASRHAVLLAALSA